MWNNATVCRNYLTALYYSKNSNCCWSRVLLDMSGFSGLQMFGRGFLPTARWGRPTRGSVQLWGSTAHQPHGWRNGFLPQVQRGRACRHRTRHSRQVNSQTHHTQIERRELHVHVSLSSDSYGNMTEEMKPFWHLARVASSFIMLRESTENTEFNMAQVASVAQQVSCTTCGTVVRTLIGTRDLWPDVLQANLEEQLMLKYHVLLHDMPSQVTHASSQTAWNKPEWCHNLFRNICVGFIQWF